MIEKELTRLALYWHSLWLKENGYPGWKKCMKDSHVK